MRMDIRKTVENMLKKKLFLEQIPCIIVDYSAYDVAKHIYDCFEKYKTFNNMERYEILSLTAPLTENSSKWNEFFELYTMQSQYHQNRFYGVAEMNFSRWVGQKITLDIFGQMFDFISKNSGNCVFILSNLSVEQIPEEYKRINCIIDEKLQTPSEYLNTKCSEYKVKLKGTEKEAIVQILANQEMTNWGIIFREIVNELYENNMRFRHGYLEDFNRKQFINNKKIGF